MLKIILAIAIMFTAIGIVCAVGFALRRGPARIGRRRPPAADPLLHPFGEVMPLPRISLSDGPAEGFTAEDWTEISAGPATRADQGSGGNGNASQGAAAARPYRGRERRGF